MKLLTVQLINYTMPKLKKKKLNIIVIAYRQFLKKTLNSINNNNIQLLINYLY